MLTSSNDGRTAKMNKLIWRIFTKKHGITLQQDAVEFLLERFHGSGEDDDDDDWQVPLDDVQRTLEFVAEQFVRRQDKSVGLDNSSSSLVGKDALQALIDGVMRSAMQTNDGLASVNVQDYIHVIDAFQLARWEYDPHSKQFKHIAKHEGGLLGGPHDKIASFRRRYEILRQRLLRNEMFQRSYDPNSLHGKSDLPQTPALKLSTVKAVKGQEGQELCCLFGLLSQIVEGQYFLEDPEDYVRLDFSQLGEAEPGVYTEGSMVLIQGVSKVDCFQVHHMAMPPSEPPSLTRQLQPYPDPFEGSVKRTESRELLQKMQELQGDAIFLVFSDVWLDNETCLTKFGQILRSQYSDAPPAVIVMMGKFLSAIPPGGLKAMKAYEDGFERLARLINSIKTVKNYTRFVFVPSQEDAFYPNILPRPSLPVGLFEVFKQFGIDHVATSNPCHLSFFNRNILFFRQEATAILERCRINSINHKDASCSGQVLLDQACLSPISLTVQPTQWTMDHSLCPYPSPDILCLAEKLIPSLTEHNWCKIVNPGDFLRNGLSYAIIQPALNNVFIRKFADEE